MWGNPKGGLCEGRAKPSTKAVVCRTSFWLSEDQRQRVAYENFTSPIFSWVQDSQLWQKPSIQKKYNRKVAAFPLDLGLAIRLRKSSASIFGEMSISP
jgi:hypothetical protein